MADKNVRWYIKMRVSAIYAGYAMKEGIPRAVVCLNYRNPADRQIAVQIAKEMDQCGLTPSVSVWRYDYDGERVNTTVGVPYIVVMFEVMPLSSEFFRSLRLPRQSFATVAEQPERSLIMTAEADFPNGIPDEFYEQMQRDSGFYLEIITLKGEDSKGINVPYATEWSRWLTTRNDTTRLS